MKPRTIEIRHLRATTRGGLHRVTADVAGREVWFESPDLPLRASAEALGSALLIPALARRSCLELPGEVCPQWLEQTGQVIQIVNQWWQYPVLPLKAAARARPARARPAGTALCFSGGLDSFYSLLRGGHHPDWLVCVQGFDFKLDDDVRLAPLLASVRQVAAQHGARPVLIRTNLRQHPLVAATPWQNAHGGALAAFGHLLGEHVGRLVVASSVPPTCELPWGSHRRLDPLWSSGEVAVVHDGAGVSRAQKARAIAGEPLLFNHLRVCFENRTPTGNCSVCDKCLSTMLLLEQAGQIDNYVVFQRPQSFVERLDALPGTQYQITYGEMCQRGLPPAVQAAVVRLLRRTAVENVRQPVLKRWLRRARTLWRYA